MSALGGIRNLFIDAAAARSRCLTQYLKSSRCAVSDPTSAIIALRNCSPVNSPFLPIRLRTARKASSRSLLASSCIADLVSVTGASNGSNAMCLEARFQTPRQLGDVARLIHPGLQPLRHLRGHPPAVGEAAEPPVARRNLDGVEIVGGDQEAGEAQARRTVCRPLTTNERSIARGSITAFSRS